MPLRWALFAPKGGIPKVGIPPPSPRDIFEDTACSDVKSNKRNRGGEPKALKLVNFYEHITYGGGFLTLQIHSERPPRRDRARDPENLKKIPMLRFMLSSFWVRNLIKHQSETQHVFKMLVHNFVRDFGYHVQSFWIPFWRHFGARVEKSNMCPRKIS